MYQSFCLWWPGLSPCDFVIPHIHTILTSFSQLVLAWILSEYKLLIRLLIIFYRMASSKPTVGRPGAWWTPGKEKKQQTSNSPHKLKKLSPFHAKIAEDAKNCLITGLDLTWDGNIVIADRNNSKVKLFDHNGKFVSSMTLPEKPNDVAVISASKFAVCMWFQQIGIVKITDDDELVLTDTIRLDYNIWAITARDDNLIITCTTEPRSVKLITLGGDVLWSVATTSDGSVLFDSPYFITSSPCLMTTGSWSLTRTDLH